MRLLPLVLLLLPLPAAASPCGMFGATPSSIGGCTVYDSTGRPSTTLTQPVQGGQWQSQPTPGYGRPLFPAPTINQYERRGPSWSR